MNVEGSAFVLRRNWIPVIASAVAVACGVAIAWTGGAWAPLAYLAVWLGGVMGPIFFLRNAFPRATPTMFRASATGITLEGQDELRSEDILEAKVIPRHGRDAVVELALRDGKTLSLRTGHHHARALADLLGARRTRFRLIAPFGKRFVVCFLLLAGVCLAAAAGDVDGWLMMLPGCLFYACLFGWLAGFVRGRLVVGADGFTTRWLFRERFIAFRDVAAVRGRPRFTNRAIEDTFVELASGRKLRLRTVEAPNTEEERGAESRAMLAHLAAAYERSARLLDGGVDVPSLVERGTRSARDWLSGIDALVRGGGSRYRVAAVSSDRLAELANDPSATTEARVGAAAALVRMGDEALRTRVRVSAEACAEPDLRAALLALSDARTDTAFEAALESLPPRGAQRSTA
jgi:hypothetical protein